jgi:hypothetical protein
MTDPIAFLLLWAIAVLSVYTVAIVQITFQNGQRFTLQHLFAFTTLIATILGLVAALSRTS